MKGRICIFLLIVLLAGSVFAQQSFISGSALRPAPTSVKAFGYWPVRLIFSDDVDAFMDPNDYRTLSFDSFFAEVQASRFGGQTPQGQPFAGLAGGFAKNFGPVYASIFFEGSGNDLGFGDNNSLAVLIGTGSFGAFKPFFIKDAVSTQFGLGWGMNFAAGSGLLKPEVMLSFSNAESIGEYDGVINLGAALGIDFAPAGGEASLDIQYELKFGIPENSGFYHDHFATVMYRRLYDLNSDLRAGWGFGGIGKLASQKNADTMVYYLDPLVNAGFKYRLGEVFGVNGQLVLRYTTLHNEDPAAGNESYFGGFRLEPIIGGTFSPYENLNIELSVSAPRSLNNLDFLSVNFLASFKK
ncbi:MAG: hypothetical protein LBH35_01180 [Treponema sp.]|jgi:hypothetical protein|nr:hypothetical protein [Treponema sp.]